MYQICFFFYYFYVEFVYYLTINLQWIATMLIVQLEHNSPDWWMGLMMMFLDFRDYNIQDQNCLVHSKQ